jgi:hypothetical protein
LAASSYQSASITISPGTEASGCSFPSTEHSTSMPVDMASTIATASCSHAAASAAGSSPAELTLEIPTDEPSCAGFTNTGRPRRDSWAGFAPRRAAM